MSLAHLIWFALVAILFSHQALRTKMLNQQVFINRIIGVILALLGLFLVISNI